MSLEAAAADVRAALASADTTEGAEFARRARNAVAQAILTAALEGGDEIGPPQEPAPRDGVRAHVPPELADELLALYEGGAGWTSRAIDVLRPLHELAGR